MKVLYISEYYQTKRGGGGAIVPAYLAKYMRKFGHEVELISFANGINANFPDFIKYAPYVRDITCIPYVGKKVLQRHENSYDIIHLANNTTTLLYKPRKPTIISIGSVWFQQVERRSRTMSLKYKPVYNDITYIVAKAIEKRSFKNIDHLIVPRLDLKKYLCDHGIPSSKISVIPNGVDTELFRPDPDIVKENIILFVGRGTVAKGFDTLIQATKYLEKGIRVVAVVTRVEKKLYWLGKKAGIEFIFNLTHQELAKIYQRSKIFILPSLDEVQPLTVLEAMASGLPVITTPVGSGGIVEHEKNGFIVPLKSPKELGETVNMLIQDNALVDKIGKRNREITEKKYSWNTITQRYINIYRMLVGEHVQKTAI
ncbi:MULTISPECIES: glycosyltransferase family 4 protein [unclassified Thermococcus]|uniref:glycosyltransferase family 4 protein n=1 Tax=unclassified Thermococcus TaxID=2627626 RepID=UPI001430DA26|nr:MULTISPECIES: glycosyltransferase family 4 protein [unclassified Thermococcus]